MKAELVNIPDRGLCILISDIDIEQLNNVAGYGDYAQQAVNTRIFSDVYIIADQIRDNRKIPAIKLIREQTGWGLKEAKEYIDKYMTSRNGYCTAYPDGAADRFIKDHTIQDFILTEEMIIK